MGFEFSAYFQLFRTVWPSFNPLSSPGKTLFIVLLWIESVSIVLSLIFFYLNVKRCEFYFDRFFHYFAPRLFYRLKIYVDQKRIEQLTAIMCLPIRATALLLFIFVITFNEIFESKAIAPDGMQFLFNSILSFKFILLSLVSLMA